MPLGSAKGSRRLCGDRGPPRLHQDQLARLSVIDRWRRFDRWLAQNPIGFFALCFGLGLPLRLLTIVLALGAGHPDAGGNRAAGVAGYSRDWSAGAVGRVVGAMSAGGVILNAMTWLTNRANARPSLHITRILDIGFELAL